MAHLNTSHLFSSLATVVFALSAVACLSRIDAFYARMQRLSAVMNLSAAVLNGTAEQVQRCIAALPVPADISGIPGKTLEQGWTTPVLCEATQHARPEVVRVLLKAGASANRACHPDNQIMPLHIACFRNSSATEVLRLLVAYGAEVNAREEDMGPTPLMTCAMDDKEDEAAVEVLLRSGARVEEVMLLGSRREPITPLGIALRKGHPKVVHKLVMAGAAANEIALTNALLVIRSRAVEKGLAVRMYLELLQHGGDPNFGFIPIDTVPGKPNLTALDVAIEIEDMVMLASLLKYGVRAELCPSRHNLICSAIAAFKKRHERAAAVTVLALAGAKCDTPCASSEPGRTITPLEFAQLQKDTDLTLALEQCIAGVISLDQ